MAGDNPDSLLLLATILHMITIKLSSNNYLLWKNQLLPLLAYQKLTRYIDGSIPKLPSTIVFEAMAETFGHTTSRAIWTVLEATYSHDSVKRMHALWDSHRTLKKGSSTVSKFSRKFKGICDQLNVIGHSLDENDKSHWFLCGLDRASISDSSDAPVAFVADNTHDSFHHPSTRGCDLAHAFQTQCNISKSSPYSYIDTRASVHMTQSPSPLDSATTYSRNETVFFGNGNGASISHIGRSCLSPNIVQNDVLVNCLSRETLARGRRKNGLYVLETGQDAFLAKLSSRRLQASFKLWHNRLGHVSHAVFSNLNKLGCLSVTSILPPPTLCSSCQLSKSKRLTFDLNLKRALHVLDLIQSDLWGPSLVTSTDGF
ncbi:zinc finger, CCHC-type containing LTR copia-type gag-polypeptide [Tanacetum coccineum]